jgi:transposase
VDGKVKQRTIATLGRMDVLRASGQLDDVAASLGRFAEQVAVLDARAKGEAPLLAAVSFGPVLVFERLWRELGIPTILSRLAGERQFEFDLERAVFVTVLHRLLDPGSDRAADSWCRRYAIDGVEPLQLHHFYRAMGWLGEALAEASAATPVKAVAAPLGARCTKDRIEEALFARRQDLFTDLELVFFDTTSLYFEGAGGESLGQYGHSKDSRPDLRQMVVGAVLDSTGRPLCCELWPGNTTDVTTLVPVVERLRRRFGISRLCIVGDRGMISAKTLEQLTELDCRHILGVRMRNRKKLAALLAADLASYTEIYPERTASHDPSPLKIKEVVKDGTRYIFCHNEEQARKDRADRIAIIDHLIAQLKNAKALIGNQGYRKYLKKLKAGTFEIDHAKIDRERLYDGKWVLTTDTELPAAEVALQYKQLWRVESLFRTAKSILDTRPIYHRCDDTIRGHVFCSFLALMLLHELDQRLHENGEPLREWDELKRQLEALQNVIVEHGGKRFVLRTDPEPLAAAAIRAVGTRLGPAITCQT